MPNVEIRDSRPPYAIGHVEMAVASVRDSAEFFLKIGLREVGIDDQVAILEVRGGTHIILLPSESPVVEGESAPFDLMVDDVNDTRASLEEMDLNPSEVGSSDFHKFITIREPGGHLLTINSSHVTGLPI